MIIFIQCWRHWSVDWPLLKRQSVDSLRVDQFIWNRARHFIERARKRNAGISIPLRSAIKSGGLKMLIDPSLAGQVHVPTSPKKNWGCGNVSDLGNLWSRWHWWIYGTFQCWNDQCAVSKSSMQFNCHLVPSCVNWRYLVLLVYSI